MEGQLRLFILKKGLKDDKSIYRLKRGWKLCYACDPSLQAENVRLFWNLAKIPSKRNSVDAEYKELIWKKNDIISEGYEFITKPQTVEASGTFHFYYTLDGTAEKENCDGFGYLIVDPNLIVGPYDELLSMDSIQLQTVLPKLLGCFSEWKDRLLVSKKTGYNMIHFAPLQSLNKESNSSYSISDQLVLNPAFSTPGAPCTLECLNHLVKYMREDWKVLSITDMVYNHTANNSSWLEDHPESAYNLHNCPHFRPAYLLDRLIYYTSQQIASHKLAHRGLFPDLSKVEDIQVLKDYLNEQIQSLRLEEFYTLDIPRIVASFKQALQEVLVTLKASSRSPNSSRKSKSPPMLFIQQDSLYRRLQSSVNIQHALQLYTEMIFEISMSVESESQRIITEVVKDFQERLEHLNMEKEREIQGHIAVALDNVMKGSIYRFVSMDGMKKPMVTLTDPLVDSYFTNNNPGYISRCLEEDTTNFDCPEKCKLIMAHNGWVMGDDPLNNFADSGSNVYLRRELVVWGDSVKLRYGSCPSDSPYLWQRMEQYTRETVEIFHGIRLDNCHSTPIHVAEHMMKYARSIRPDLYVIAELFTSHEDIDNIFVNRLGINSLIREGLSAWNAHEQGRLVYRYGGKPVGSFLQPNMQLLKPTVAHALFMDATHDNDSIVNKRTVYDSLSLSAYISMACCATGSNRGYDELVPHHISVVEETRLYSSWCEGKSGEEPGSCDETCGIINAKLALNNLHQYMGTDNFEQVYVHDLSDEVVSITRHNPLTHCSYICAVRSAFSYPQDSNPHCENLTFEGRIDSVSLYGMIKEKSNVQEFVKDDQYLNGLKSHAGSTLMDVSIDEVPGVTLSQASELKQTISFHDFPPGSVLIFRVLPNEGLRSAQANILAGISRMHQYISDKDGSGLQAMMSKLTLADVNALLYHCDAEEKSITGFGCYGIPNYGPLVYAGLQGILSPMASIRRNNDLGHPFCQNIREGDWLVEYTTNRIAKYQSLAEFNDFLRELMESVKMLPRYLIPSYLDMLLVAVSMLIQHAVWKNMSRFVSDGSPLIRDLAMSSLQFCGVVPSAKLAKLPPALENLHKHPVTGEPDLVSIAAGLPHFSEGLMRIWGRDTFISLRGLLLVTGRYREAKAVILSFAGSLRHGLIPNLHGEGVHARYNCRDAVWWWMQAIQDYCHLAPDGIQILRDDVLRIYPTDDSKPYCEGSTVQPLMQVMQEVMQRHADGIQFRERNAGSAIDEHMADEGFNIVAGIDWNTGFVYGGNASNCGTWMDKMGSSKRAGNKGKPATPRNGSAVELVGLCASAVRWLADLHKAKSYEYEGVAAKRKGWSHTQLVTYEIWYGLIKRNFESHFWVDGTHSSMSAEHKPELINKRNIYKDCVGASPNWSDYQLRPNFCVAMVVAPDLFLAENAVAALKVAEKELLAPLGMRTLDRSDWTYCGDYINSNDSTDYNTSRGFNYHNGPEWLWPLGYFMRAKLNVASRLEADKPGTMKVTARWIENQLSSHHLALLSTDWRSLPELTNTDGKICQDSCAAQAWSVACLLDTLYDITRLSI
ncbi:glycogen debranching enzyme-like [Watersipora subatra]|uniref:glycogen debranching enzyme-like n=1 Tax=Watersipora subatra TaxID=2589382 RepID=UPI00355B3797